MAMPHESTSSPTWTIWRYVQILWKHRLLVGCGSVLPALVLAGVIHFQAGTYRTSLVYERPLTESEYNVLQRRFYSSENLGKITKVLRDKGLADYASRLERAQTNEETLQQLIGFRVFPPHPKRLQTTDPIVSERISAFQSRLLYVDIRGDSRQNVEAISGIVAGDIESVLPLYDVRSDMREAIRQMEAQAAEVEHRRFTTSLNLQQQQARLAEMKRMDGESSSATGANAASQGGIILQLANDPNSRQLLPWSYQIRFVQTEIIDLEQSLKADQGKRDYCLKILDLNGKLLSTVERSLLKYYTAQEFVNSLEEELSQSKDEAVADYLRSCIRKTENRIFVNTRAGEKSIVYPVGKGTIRSSALAFVVLLMATAFVAVGLEYRRFTDGR